MGIALEADCLICAWRPFQQAAAGLQRGFSRPDLRAALHAAAGLELPAAAPIRSSPSPPPAAGSNAPSTAMLRRRSQILLFGRVSPKSERFTCYFLVYTPKKPLDCPKKPIYQLSSTTLPGASLMLRPTKSITLSTLTILNTMISFIIIEIPYRLEP